jgi:hypothetical protein
MPRTFVVPYASEEPKRKRAFTPEMEKAAILCLSEAKRRKPKILRGTPEEIEYIIKFHYPLWTVPWKDRCVVVDGLGLSSVTIPHNKIPSVTDFTEDLKRSSVSFSLFRKTLKKHSQTFKGFLSTKEEIVEAVIAEVSVLKSLSSLINQAEVASEQSEYDAVLFPPKFLREEAEEKAESFVSEWRRLQSEVEALQYAIEVLKEEMERHREKASIEIEQIWKDYEERISKTKKLADKRIKQLIKKKEKETQGAVKLYEKRIKKSLREERNLREKIENVKHSLKEQRRRRKVQRRKYPRRSTTRVDKRIERYQKKISDLTQDIRSLSKLKEETRREQEETLRQIETKYLSMATKEIEKLEILEQSRNLEVSEKREEIREVEEESSAIEAQVKQLIEQKTNSIEDLEGRALPFQIEETILIKIPFYLVQYKSHRKTRTDVYPPVTITTYGGMVKKIRRAISFNLEARIQLLLNTRSRELNKGIFANLEKSLEASPALREEMSEIVKPRNLLNLPSFKEEVTKGLSQLVDEGWLNAKEKESILGIYAQ